MEKRTRPAPPSLAGMPPFVTHTPVYCLDLEPTLAFYTERLGFEVRDDVQVGPGMRWLTVAAPGEEHELLLAAIDHHVPPVDQEAMRALVAKGTLPVFLRVDHVDAVFEQLRSAGVEVLQEPIDQPYGVRNCAVRDPNGNHLRLSQPSSSEVPA